MPWPSLLRGFVCLTLLLPLTAGAQAPSGDKAPQTANSTPGIPTFYAHARQVIVEAEVWKPIDKKIDKKNASDPSWIPQGSLDGVPGEITEILKLMPPPARGLTAGDFHVFDNDVEQSINYFKEADFLATGHEAQWILHPTAHGIWGAFEPAGAVIGQLPSVTYLIGYVPPAPQPRECRSIRIAVQRHYVQANRRQYCVGGNSEAATTLDTKLGARMQSFAMSTAKGSIKVSTRAFVFWSSGVLSLTRPAQSTGAAPALPPTDFTYVVEVHDSKAPANVEIATEFALPYRLWNLPCPRRRSSIYVLGLVYNAAGEVADKFDDMYTCDMSNTPMMKPIDKVPGAMVIVESRFDSQVELRPGDYELRVVVSDGKNFGRARVPLRVQPFDGRGVTISDLAISSFLRDSSWVLRDAASVSPAPIVPIPLVSKKVQFFPAVDATLRNHSHLSLYFEIYEPLLETEKTAVSYQLTISDLKSGSLVMNTGPMSAANWVLPRNIVIPIGLKVDTEKLPPGTYRLELQASDSAGRQTEWRQADFMIE